MSVDIHIPEKRPKPKWTEIVHAFCDIICTSAIVYITLHIEDFILFFITTLELK